MMDPSDDAWMCVQVAPGKFLFKTTSGMHMCSEPDGRIVADREKPDKWELFYLVKSVDDEEVSEKKVSNLVCLLHYTTRLT